MSPIAPARRTARADVVSSGCAWQVELTGGGGSLTDAYASYWETTMTSVPGAEMTFQGSFPTARYMSFGLDDPNGEPPPAPSQIYDAQLTPDSGENRFQVGQTGAGTYTLHVVAGTAPATPAANTIYTGTTDGGAFRLIYRIYDSNVPGDPTGGVGLPTDTTSLNGVVQSTGTACYSPTPSSSSNALAKLSPDALAAPSPVSAKRSTQAVSANVLPGHLARPYFVSPDTALSSSTNRNLDAGYLGATIYPNVNDVVVIRIKAPTFPDTDTGQPPWQAGRQVRYWSMCTYLTPSNTIGSCVDDANAVTSGGYATFVIATAANQPTNATAANGVNYLPIPGVWDNTVVYRQLVASPSFTQSIAAIKHPLLPFLTMWGYTPTAAYCTVTTFEAVGATGCLAGGS